ncbi:helix-turn-helix domain-containing protein [Psychroserpens luteus]|uniref:Helix-turn-helix domain-containing protein n=1 Tax=Psychroserpens luteus TaxID=1434066 RepID=A0ABW5ZN96_9FLAO|nr:AraC family transcriptional regulator [Psychroserpens luteus]
MITVQPEINELNSFFENLQIELGGNLISNGKENILEIDRELGKGTIRSIDLGDQISFLEFDLNLNEDVKITLNAQVGNYVNFAYCSKGKFSHSFANSNNKNTIDNFQTGIVSNIQSKTNTLYLYKDMHIQSSIIYVNTENANDYSSNINASLKDLFISNKQEDFIHLGSFNLKIAEYIKQLRAIKQEGIVRSLLIKGLVNVILALEIEQHKEDIANAEYSSCSLTRTELKSINELIDYVDNYPDLDHKLDILTKKIGLSAAKIQEGFKMTKGLTVCEYIRYVRLSKAEELMSTTDLNISEIVYSLGFTSRSYFSKIFKERFSCAPSHYKKKVRLAVSA